MKTKLFALVGLLFICTVVWAIESSTTSSNFLPATDNAQSLGDANQRWDVFADAVTVGSTLTVTGLATLTGGLASGQDLTVDELNVTSMTVSGVSSLAGGLISGQDLTVDELNVTSMTVSGVTSLAGGLISGQDLTIDEANITSLTVSGTSILTGAQTLTGATSINTSARVGGANGSVFTFLKAGTMSVANGETTGTLTMTGTLPGDRIIGWAWRTGNSNGVSLKTSSTTTDSVSITCADPGTASTADLLVARY